MLVSIRFQTNISCNEMTGLSVTLSQTLVNRLGDECRVSPWESLSTAQFLPGVLVTCSLFVFQSYATHVPDKSVV